MSKVNDGGPAFAYTVSVSEVPDVAAMQRTAAQSGQGVYGYVPPAQTQKIIHTSGGMSLRDYFAAAALQGFIGGPSMEVLKDVARRENLDEQTFIVRTAFQLADAMLKEREHVDK